MDNKGTVKAIQVIVNEESINDSDKLDIIKRIIEIAHSVEVVKSFDNTPQPDNEGWYSWDAEKENVEQDFVPEHIRGKRIVVRYVDGDETNFAIPSESHGFDNAYDVENIAAYKVVE